MANSVDPDRTAPIGAFCSRSTVFASILKSSVMLDNYLQQKTSADDIFKCIFSWRSTNVICMQWCRSLYMGLEYNRMEACWKNA